MADDEDSLERTIAERTTAFPAFPALVAANRRSRQLLHTLITQRKSLGLTQSELARRMEISQAALARLESGDVDPKVSTLHRYAVALGQQLDWRLVEQDVASATTDSRVTTQAS